MAATLSHIKTRIIYGAMLLIPLGIVLLVLAKVVDILGLVAQKFDFDSTYSAGIAIVLALILVLVACYAIGAAIQTRIGGWTFEKLESRVLKQLPFYKVASNMLKGFAASAEVYPPVLVRLSVEGVAVLAMLIEENDNGTVTVFVPSTPALTIGTLYVVEPGRVQHLEATTVDLFNCIGEWGIGSRELLGTQTPLP
jgi:uncharacterized membrane protein